MDHGVDALLAGLDPAQRLAVTSPEPVVAVLAGAGSGKTTVLARRIAHRVATGSAAAAHTVAITFTREAAAELRRRLRRLGLRDQVTAGTFHATAFGLLRQHWSDRGRRPPTVVADRARLVAEAASTGAGRRAVRELVAEIDWATARLVPPERYEELAGAANRRTAVAPGVVAQVFADYQRLKLKRGVIDLDDLLVRCLAAGRDDPTFVDVVRWRFRHVHVDEAQDLNPLQLAVLTQWTGQEPDLFLVGDPCQAIYGWNGADPAALTEVHARFPGVAIVRLDTNYRSTPQVVAAGRHVLRGSGLADELVSGRPDGPPVRIVGYPDAAGEARGVVQIVRQLRAPGASWSSVAVLARTNAVAAQLADALEAANIPVRTRSRRDPLDTALAEAGAQTSIHELAAWAAAVADDTSVDTDEPRRRVAAAVDTFIDVTGGGDGRTFVSWVALTGALGDRPGPIDAVDVLTFHAAKGREWPAVVVCGFEVGLVPHAGALDPSTRAEEARLAYVAITRGAEQVVVTYAAERDGRPAGPSPLLDGFEVADEPVVAPPPRLVTPRPPVEPVLLALDAWRAGAARAAAVPPAVVCGDEALRRLAAARPTTVEAVADVLGPLAARRFGPRIVEVVAASS
jgi:DNA helicase-2/ATP-dependent DNA helicase PcrA